MTDNPYQQPTAFVGPGQGLVARPFVARLLLGSASAFALVFACATSLRGVGWSIEDLLGPAIGVAIAAVPAGLFAATIVRRSEAGLILLSQLLTILGLFAWFSARA